MTRPHLQVYFGPDDDGGSTVVPSNPTTQDTVTVPFGDVLPLLVDAAKSQRAWLGDFANDEITISSDLYEVLLAYQLYCRPSA
jgi:hypothetical protein